MRPENGDLPRALIRHTICAFAAALQIWAGSTPCFAQADPASEPAVLAVAKVLPAVVNINTERVVRRTVRDPFEDFYAQFFGYDRVRPRQIRQTLQSLGSGFIIDPAGYIVTNQHVVERAADLKIHVTTNDDKTYNAHYISGDDKTDLAFIKIDAKEPFRFINLDNISPNLLGETVIVVGNAVGYGSSISRGVLSAVKRNITVDDIEYKDLVQTDAAINPGNSGGPVIDISGRLVGISSAKMAFTPQGVPTQGLGFAIPAEVVRDSVARFKKIAQKQTAGKKQPVASDASISNAERLFGLQLQDLSQELSDALGYPRGGVVITAVEPRSPADEAGVERGLVIYHVGSSEVNSVTQIEKLLSSVQSGTTANFTIGAIRGSGESQQVATVTVTAR
ncbi:MAG: serine protease [Verrucomicrobia bacterium]|nr:MAG: serine protease [Verrucomicrobiota bacterium]PYK34234.1 MAG: serine protease [Verrucomicrobiota bacterium]PYL19793.1 MAG: serine protease [Verrucomicrobiota bacterium]